MLCVHTHACSSPAAAGDALPWGSCSGAGLGWAGPWACLPAGCRCLMSCRLPPPCPRPSASLAGAWAVRMNGMVTFCFLIFACIVRGLRGPSSASQHEHDACWPGQADGGHLRAPGLRWVGLGWGALHHEDLVRVCACGICAAGSTPGQGEAGLRCVPVCVPACVRAGGHACTRNACSRLCRCLHGRMGARTHACAARKHTACAPTPACTPCCLPNPQSPQ